MSKEKPIAELNAEMWVVVAPNGTMLTNTLHPSKDSCMNIFDRFYGWVKNEGKGYRCIPVSVNIKPIDNG